MFPLNFEGYKAEIKSNESKIEFFEKIEEYKSDLKFSSLPYELAQIENDTILGEKRRRWHNNLVQDVYVEEAVNVLSDINAEKSSNKFKLGVLDKDNE